MHSASPWLPAPVRYNFASDDEVCEQLEVSLKDHLEDCKVGNAIRRIEGELHFYTGYTGGMTWEYNTPCKSFHAAEICSCVAENNLQIFEESTGATECHIGLDDDQEDEE